MATKYLYPDSEKWEEEFVNPLNTLTIKYHDCIDYGHIGFPQNWKEELLK